jgi:hypothetical protein
VELAALKEKFAPATRRNTRKSWIKGGCMFPEQLFSAHWTGIHIIGYGKQSKSSASPVLRHKQSSCSKATIGDIYLLLSRILLSVIGVNLRA